MCSCAARRLVVAVPPFTWDLYCQTGHCPRQDKTGARQQRRSGLPSFAGVSGLAWPNVAHSCPAHLSAAGSTVMPMGGTPITWRLLFAPRVATGSAYSCGSRMRIKPVRTEIHRALEVACLRAGFARATTEGVRTQRQRPQPQVGA